jgi:hypothetical protein
MQLNDTKDFLGRHKKAALLVLAAILLLAGFAAGRYSSTAQVIEKEKVVTKYQDKLVYQDRIVEKKVFLKAEQKREHVETVETKHADGTVVTQTKRDTDTNTGINQTTNTDSTHALTETKYVTQIVEREKQVLKQPSWKMWAGAGVSLPYYLGQGEVGIPGLRGFVVQLGAERRLAGPFWVGLWGNTQGSVGLNLSVTW